jgi:hypothetical protein
MDSTKALIEEFPGDQAWDVFASAVQQECTDKVEVGHLVQELADDKIATTLVSTLGGNARVWLDTPCKALDNLRPIDVFRHAITGPQIIKALLMRMPR